MQIGNHCDIISLGYPGMAQLVARLTGGQEAVSSSLATRTNKKSTSSEVLFLLVQFYSLTRVLFSSKVILLRSDIRLTPSFIANRIPLLPQAEISLLLSQNISLCTMCRISLENHCFFRYNFFEVR